MKVIIFLKNKFNILLFLIWTIAVIIFCVHYWDFFKSNSAGIQALTTLFLIIITAYYTYFTYKMSVFMKLELENKFIPDFAIRFINRNASLFFIEIENISNVEIFEMQFKEFPDIPITDKIRTSGIGFLKNGINYLAPGQKYSALFINYVCLAEENMNKDILIFDIDFKNKEKKCFNKKFNFNLNMFKEIMPGSNILDAFDLLNKNIEKIAKKK